MASGTTVSLVLKEKVKLGADGKATETRNTQVRLLSMQGFRSPADGCSSRHASGPALAASGASRRHSSLAARAPLPVACRRPGCSPAAVPHAPPAACSLGAAC
jgi:hypothetical protein